MFGISPTWWKIIGGLVVANLAYYFYTTWGLITVKVTDAPLSQVIRSIEWQEWDWVKIYTNLAPDSKVTMFVDHVPLPEAMETLAANVDVPPPPADGIGDGARPNGIRPPRASDAPGTPAGATPLGGGVFGRPGTGAPGGPPGGRGGGFGRQAQWNLAFFVGPTSSDVKQEIRAFETSDPDANNKVYTYGTQLQLIASDTVTSAADPRSQAWPGFKPVDPSTAPPAAPTNAAPSSSTGNGPVDPPAPTTPTLHTYLQAFAASANIWIMAPGSWLPEVSAPPPPDPSIIHAVKNLVGGSHGFVTEAIILRAGRGGARGEVAAGDDGWADRLRNAISGLPPEERPDALDQLNHEIQFRKDVQSLPPEQRRQKMFEHFMERLIYGERLSRMSPTKRAQMYQRMVAAREAARAPK